MNNSVCYWRGKLILDMVAFCREHRTDLVRYVGKKMRPGWIAGTMVEEAIEGEAPGLMYDNMRVGDYHFHVIQRTKWDEL